MYACPNCGSNIRFDPATQKMKCSYCDTMISPHEYMSAKGADEEKGVDLAADEYEVTYYTCPQCGGELITEDNTAATFCSYCGASTILEMRVGKEKKPDYIIPFKKTKEECAAEYKKVLRRAIFAPSDLRKDETIERFRGIYMPYWIYDLKSGGDLSANGDVSTRRGDYIYTKHYKVSSNVDTDYSGISYDASSSFEDRLSEAIAPFDLKESDYFTSSYLSGFYADTSDVDPKIYNDDAKALVGRDIADKVYKEKAYSRHGVSLADVATSAEKRPTSINTKLGMFPVWFLSNQHGDRVSYAVVNGQTGKVAMDLPIDIKKYFLGVAALSIPIFLSIVLTGFVITPKLLVLITMAISIVVLVLADSQGNALYVRELLYDDKGYNSKRPGGVDPEVQKQVDAGERLRKVKAKIKPKSGRVSVGSFVAIGIFAISFGRLMGPVVFVLGIIGLVIYIIVSVTANKSVPKDRIIIKAPVSKKVGTSIFPIISMAQCGLVLLINPFHDAYYYGTAILGMVMTGFAVARLVAKHNRLTSRKLPQFNKRGGEEHEFDY